MTKIHFHSRVLLILVALAPIASLSTNTQAEGLEEKLFNYQLFLANKGDPKFQYDVGARYEQGEGVEQDFSMALDWYRKAAEQGHAEAQYRLAHMLERGMGAEADMEAAERWYSKAAANGHDQAMHRLQKGPATPPPEKAKPAPSQTAETASPKTAATDRSREAVASSKPASPAPKKAEKPIPPPAKPPAAKTAKAQAAGSPSSRSSRATPSRSAARGTTASATKPKPAATPKPAQNPRPGVARSTPEKASAVRASAPQTTSPPPRPRFDDVSAAAAYVANRTWDFFGQPADYLPSANTRCLQAGDAELVCFSKEGKRTVAGERLTYSAKAVIDGFDRDGSFNVSYVYNVTDIDRTDAEGVAVDPHGLKVQKGWQEPGRRLRCRIDGGTELLCSGPTGSGLVFQSR